jgi:glutathione S-transferase
MQHFAWTSLVTVAALIVYLMMIVGVGRARAKFGVPAPATTGDPQFERHFRVQMNTLEWLPIFLPSLWLFAFYWSDPIAAAIGAFWVVGRLLYMTAYARDPKSRSPGFGIQGVSALILLLGTLIGAVYSLLPA